MTECLITSFDGTPLHIVEQGAASAPSVVLSHSLGGTLQQWDSLSQALSPRFRVIRYDTRGHGRSGAPRRAYSVEDLGGDALAVFDALSVGRAHFVGLSQGGMCGMWLAANAPDRIEKLVLANTTAFIPAKDHWDALIRTALDEGLAEIAPKTIAGWLGDTYKRAYPSGVDALVRTMAGMSPIGYAGAIAVLRDCDLRADLARIAAPTLVVAGMEDGARAAAAAALTAGIPGARQLDLPAAGHLSPIENPEAFNAAVLEFLA